MTVQKSERGSSRLKYVALLKRKEAKYCDDCESNPIKDRNGLFDKALQTDPTFHRNPSFISSIFTHDSALLSVSFYHKKEVQSFVRHTVHVGFTHHGAVVCEFDKPTAIS